MERLCENDLQKPITSLGSPSNCPSCALKSNLPFCHRWPQFVEFFGLALDHFVGFCFFQKLINTYAMGACSFLSHCFSFPLSTLPIFALKRLPSLNMPITEPLWYSTTISNYQRQTKFKEVCHRQKSKNGTLDGLGSCRQQRGLAKPKGYSSR